MVMHARKSQQITGTGTIKEGANNREILTMPFHLGPFDIVIIASVPDEGTHKFPFYVKFEMHPWVHDIAAFFKNEAPTAATTTAPPLAHHAHDSSNHVVHADAE